IKTVLDRRAYTELHIGKNLLDGGSHYVRRRMPQAVQAVLKLGSEILNPERKDLVGLKLLTPSFKSPQSTCLRVNLFSFLLSNLWYITAGQKACEMFGRMVDSGFCHWGGGRMPAMMYCPLN